MAPFPTDRPNRPAQEPSTAQLSLASTAQGADHPLTELARLLGRQAARRCYQDQLQERRSKDS